MLGKVTLVTGGARSGKSRYALELASEAQNPVFVATASVMDKEMELRVAKHQEERLGRFVTLEEQTDLAGVFSRLPSGTGVVLVDCLTLWLSNVMAAGRDAGLKLMEIKRLRERGHRITLVDEARFWRLVKAR